MSVDIKPGWLIAIGAIWGATVGALILLISRSSKQLGAAPMAPINIWNVSGGLQGALPPPPEAARPQPVELAAPEESVPSRMSTYKLQTDRAIRIMTAASKRYWRAQVRTIGPPNGIAQISTDINGTAFPSMSVEVPTGYPYEIRVKPGDALFALGNIPNVVLSVTATEELT